MFGIKLFGFDFYYIFYTFILYSIFGWIYESCLVSVRKKSWVNRGFLNGPIIPIYGAGAVLICIVLDPVSKNYLLVFLGGMTLATILEFVTSYIMEKLFHAKWWDYSRYKWNIQGRICPLVSLFWGVLSVLMTIFLKPLSDSMIRNMPRRTGEVLALVILFLVLADLITTVISTLKLNQKLASMRRVREEFAAYIEKTKLYASKEEFIKHLESGTMVELVNFIHQKMEENRLNKERSSKYVELEEKIHMLKERYSLHSDHVHIIQRRLLRAFPNMRSTNNEYMLTDLRAHLKEMMENSRMKRKEKKAKENK